MKKYSSLVFVALLIGQLLAVEYSVENAFPNINFEDPVGIYHAEDGSDRLFVIEQEGKIKVFNNLENIQQTQTFLDITTIVDQDPGYTEEGLLGLAFNPNYNVNGYFYVHYTDYGPKRNVVARYTVSNDNPNQANPQSSVIIIEVNQPYSNNTGFLKRYWIFISFVMICTLISLFFCSFADIKTGD